jgi:uncharacterized membrane protein YraQ (UPF0718 family)
LIKPLADWLVYHLIGLSPETHLGEALDYFVWDIIKIFLMMLAIIFAVSYLRSYLSPEKVRHFLAQKLPLVGNLLAALVGVATPFCSCSAVPLFIGFVEAGVPLGVTFSFLVCSPMVNEVALVLLFALLGARVALIYLTSGLAISLLSGMLIGGLKMEKYLQDYVRNIHFGKVEEGEKTQKDRFRFAWAYTRDIIRRIWLFIIIGIALGAFIHGYVPADFLLRFTAGSAIWGVPLAVLVGIPLYSSAAGMIPIITALLEKGLPLGTALAFMMAVTAISPPEFIILKQVMKSRLLVTFGVIITVAIIFTGYLFNWLI